MTLATLLSPDLTRAVAPVAHSAKFGNALYYGVPFADFQRAYPMPLRSLLDAFYAGPNGALACAIVAGLTGIFFLAMGSIAGAPLAGIAAAGWYALENRSLELDVRHLSFSCMTALLACTLLWRSARPTVARTFVLALALGASLLLRSSFFLFGPALAFWELAARRQVPRGVRFTCAALLLAIPFLVLAPWTRLNWAVHRRFIPFEFMETDANIVSAALGLVPVMEAGNVGWTPLVPAHPDPTRPGAVLRWAVGETLRHPWRYARGYAERLAWASSFRALLAPVFLLGLLRRRKDDAARAPALMVVYFVAIHCTMAISRAWFAPIWPVAAFVCALGILPEKTTWAAPRASAALKGAAAASLFAVLALSASAEILLWRYARVATQDIPPQSVLAAAAAAHPRSAWLRTELGAGDLEAGRFQDASLEFARAAALNPRDEEARFGLAEALIRQGHPGALMTFRYARGDSERAVAGGILRSWFDWKSGRVRDAERNLRETAAVWRDTIYLHRTTSPLERESQARLRAAAPGAFVNLLDYRLLRLRVPTADRLALARLLAPEEASDADYWLRLAELSARAGETTPAKEALKKAAAGLSEPVRALRAARLWDRLGERARAGRAAETALRGDPENVDARMLLARLAVLDGKTETADRLLERIESSEMTASQRMHLSWVYEMKGDAARQIAALRRAEAEAESANRASVHYARGKLAITRGDYALAVDELTLTLELDERRMLPDTASALTQALLALHRDHDAWRLFARAKADNAVFDLASELRKMRELLEPGRRPP